MSSFFRVQNKQTNIQRSWGSKRMCSKASKHKSTSNTPNPDNIVEGGLYIPRVVQIQSIFQKALNRHVVSGSHITVLYNNCVSQSSQLRFECVFPYWWKCSTQIGDRILNPCAYLLLLECTTGYFAAVYVWVYARFFYILFCAVPALYILRSKSKNRTQRHIWK